MTIDITLVQKRRQEILTLIKQLEGFSQITLADFLKNNERQYAVMHALQLAIEGCLSIGNHIIARERLGIPKNYQDTFTLLEKSGKLPSEFAEEMKKMARFRNRLVHIYWDVDAKQLYTILTTKLDDFKKFVWHIQQAYPA